MELGEIRSLHGGPIKPSEGKYSKEANLIVALNDELDDKRESHRSSRAKSSFFGAIGELIAIIGGAFSFARFGKSDLQYPLAAAASGALIRVAAGYVKGGASEELAEIDRAVDSAVRKALKENELSPRENYRVHFSRVSFERALEEQFPQRYKEYLEGEIKSLKAVKEDLNQVRDEMSKECQEFEKELAQEKKRLATR